VNSRWKLGVVVWLLWFVLLLVIKVWLEEEGA
jgi:hypothetical protein